MKRIEILCPNCFKKKLLSTDDKEAYCDGCGQEYVIIDSNTVKFK